MIRRCSTARITKIIREALRDGHPVEIEGFGVFRPLDGCDEFEFVPESQPRIFIAYVQEDLGAARRLFRDLKTGGYQPWLDKENLLPGQNWPRSIDRAIEISDFFMPCFSHSSVLKRGVFQSELRFALDCASRLPLDDTFVIPVRLDDCILPDRVTRILQHVDFFPDWEAGLAEVHRSIDYELARKRKRKLPLAS